MAEESGPKKRKAPEGLSEEQRQEIARVLEARGATQPCPRCGNRTFSVLEGYFAHTISVRPGLVLGGPAVPVAVITCNNCGFLSEHALGVLGLLTRESDE